MAIWDDTLTERDKEVFAKSGYGKRAGFGQRPAVLVIDMNYNFVGDRPEPILPLPAPDDDGTLFLQGGCIEDRKMLLPCAV